MPPPSSASSACPNASPLLPFFLKLPRFGPCFGFCLLLSTNSYYNDRPSSRRVLDRLCTRCAIRHSRFLTVFVSNGSFIYTPRVSVLFLSLTPAPVLRPLSTDNDSRILLPVARALTYKRSYICSNHQSICSRSLSSTFDFPLDFFLSLSPIRAIALRSPRTRVFPNLGLSLNPSVSTLSSCYHIRRSSTKSHIRITASTRRLSILVKLFVFHCPLSTSFPLGRSQPHSLPSPQYLVI